MTRTQDIFRSFEIVTELYNKTYDLTEALDKKALNHGFIGKTPIYLRREYNIGNEAWLNENIVKLYQLEEDLLMGNNWRHGNLYGINFSFLGQPKITLAKYRNHIDKWHEDLSPYSCWQAVEPTEIINTDKFKFTEEGDYILSTPLNHDIYNRYWQLIDVIFKYHSIDLVDQEGFVDMVFEEFKNMRELVL